MLEKVFEFQRRKKKILRLAVVVRSSKPASKSCDNFHRDEKRDFARAAVGRQEVRHYLPWLVS